MANKLFTVEDQNGNNLCTTCSKLPMAKQFAMNKAKTVDGVQVIERDADYNFVRLRGMVSNKKYITVTR